jgi:2-polyprenyl-3-methyl-5-hydroxy-6-metoxy-1,4-benzoquinol methylase
MVSGILGPLDAGRLIDLGCGDGSVSLQFAEFVDEIALVDSSEAMLAAARRNAAGGKAKLTFLLADLTNDELRIEPADVVLCLGLLAHVARPREVLTRAAALVRPGGRLLMQVTDAARPFGAMVWQFDNLFRGIRGYRLARTGADELAAWASESDLRLVTALSHAPVISGFRVLPEQAQRTILDILQRGGWAEPLRVEKLMLFERPGSQS